MKKNILIVSIILLVLSVLSPLLYCSKIKPLIVSTISQGGCEVVQIFLLFFIPSIILLYVALKKEKIEVPQNPEKSSIFKSKKFWIVLIIIILIVIIFYPKSYVVGGMQGFLGFYEDKSVGLEEYKCLGITYDYNPVGCSDCGKSHLCFGIRHSKKCFTQILSQDIKQPITKTEVQCK